jgi:hypothetical protein
MDRFLTATEARQQFLKLLDEDPQSLNHIRAAHEEVRKGHVLRLKGAPMVKRLVELARSKGLLKSRGA